jgi:hypothetical protein
MLIRIYPSTSHGLISCSFYLNILNLSPVPLSFLRRFRSESEALCNSTTNLTNLRSVRPHTPSPRQGSRQPPAIPIHLSNDVVSRQRREDALRSRGPLPPQDHRMVYRIRQGHNFIPPLAGLSYWAACCSVCSHALSP